MADAPPCGPKVSGTRECEELAWRRIRLKHVGGQTHARGGSEGEEMGDAQAEVVFDVWRGEERWVCFLPCPFAPFSPCPPSLRPPPALDETASPSTISSPAAMGLFFLCRRADPLGPKFRLD